MSEAFAFICIALLATGMIVLRSGRQSIRGARHPLAVRIWAGQAQPLQSNLDTKEFEVDLAENSLVPPAAAPIAQPEPSGSVEILYRPQTGIRDRATSLRVRSR
jgi:hypothetical protein